MEEYTTYGKSIMKNIRELLLEYKKEHSLTNAEMSVRCDISLSEYDKIMNTKMHSNHGCSADTICKIHKNTGIRYDDIFNIQE